MTLQSSADLPPRHPPSWSTEVTAPNVDVPSTLNPVTAAVLEKFDRRRRGMLLIRGAAAGWVSLMVLAALVALADQRYWLPPEARWTLSVATYAGTMLVVWWFALKDWKKKRLEDIATQFATTEPGLREDVLSAVELANQQNGSARFRERLQQVVARRVAALKLSELLPMQVLRPWLVTSITVLVLLVALMLVPGLQMGRRMARVLLPGASIQRASWTRLTLIEPAPPTRTVAKGDAVAVVVEIADVRSLARDQQVRLQYEGRQLGRIDVPMTSRLSLPTDSSDGSSDEDAVRGRFAANLSMGADPVRYRVIAGDAISSWHTLTPRSRPKVVSFCKHYVMPEYTGLPDRDETAAHGDLHALIGTQAQLTVQFDQPVEDAVIVFGSGGGKRVLQPVGGADAKAFQTDIRITSWQTYQIDAVSKQSGLSNPFSESYAVTGIVDSAPVVRWSDAISKQQVVSPLDQLELAATAADELPIKMLFQEFQVNTNGEIHQHEVARDCKVAQIAPQWRWDLLALVDKDGEKIRLRSGDILRTRLVAVDRAGKASYSSYIERLITDESFRADRHDELEQLHRTFVPIIQWTSTVGSWMAVAEPSIHPSQTQQFAELLEQLDPDLEKANQLIDRIGDRIENSRDASAASRLERVGQSLAELKEKAHQWSTHARWMVASGGALKPSYRTKRWRQLRSDSKRLGRFAEQIESFVQAQFSHELALAVTSDQMELFKTVSQVVRASEPPTPFRLARNAVVWAGRLEELDQLIEKYQSGMLETSRSKLESWRTWSGRSIEELKKWNASQLESERTSKNAVRFCDQLERWFYGSIYDGRCASSIIRAIRELRLADESLGDLLELLRVDRENSAGKISRANSLAERDSDPIRLSYQQVRFDSGYRRILALANDRERLHRSHPEVDLQYASDLSLFQQAVRFIAGPQNRLIDRPTTSNPYKEVARAIEILQSGHEIRVLKRQIEQLADRESAFIDDHLTRLDHPLRLESLPAALEHLLGSLQEAGVPWELLQTLDAIRSRPAYQQARERISRRRWSDAPLVTSQHDVQSIASELGEGLAKIEPFMKAARESLQPYVRTIPELARAAAQQSDQARSSFPGLAQNAFANDDASEEAGNIIVNQTQLDEAIRMTRQTVGAIHDYANTADPFDDRERLLARDADAAAAKILDAVRRVEDGKSSFQGVNSEEQLSTNLGRLAKTLREVADHFESIDRVDQDQQLAQSRRQLREAERELGVDDDLRERHQGIEEAVEDFNLSPPAMLARLENELARDASMSWQLDKLVDTMTDSLQREIAALQRQQLEVGRALERSDPGTFEVKRRLSKQITTVAQRAAMVDQIMIETIHQAADAAGIASEHQNLQAVRKHLRKAVSQSREMIGENARLAEIRQTALEMAAAMQQATELIDDVRKRAIVATETKTNQPKAEIASQQARLQQMQADVRRRVVDQSTRERADWLKEESSSKKRVTQSRRRAEELERRLSQHLNRTADKRDDAQSRSWKDQIDQANRSVIAAKKTAQNAKSNAETASKQVKAIQKQPLTSLDAPNPSAQFASEMSARTTQELINLRKQLGKVNRDANLENQIQLTAESSRPLIDRQMRIGENLAEARQTLSRMARHKNRLDQPLGAEPFEALAKQLKQHAEPAVDQAAGALQQASQSGQQAGQATGAIEASRQQLQKASEAFQQPRNAKELESGASADQNRQPASDPASLAAASKAKAIDELDRAVNQSVKSPSVQSPQAAGQVSRTLSAALDAKRQQAARHRRQSTQIGKSNQSSNGEADNQSFNEPGDQPAGNEGDSDGKEPGSGSGTGDNQGSIDLAAVKTRGSDWGALRKRRADEISENNSIRLPASYRREIEAYFQAIAKQAARE